MLRRILASAVLLLAAMTGALLIGGAGVAAADPAAARVTVPAAYQDVVIEQIKALCMDHPATGNDTPCGDQTEALWIAAAKCSEGTSAVVEVGSEAKKDFMECMAKEDFGEKDEEKTEDPAETTEQMAKLTLGRVSASLTAFYVNALSPAADGSSVVDTGLVAWAPVLGSPGMAGGFVGALDRNKGESNEWLFGQGNSANTSELQYRAFDRLIPTGALVGTDAIPGVSDAGTQAYLNYGATLAGLGLDTTVSRNDGLSGLLNAPGPRGYMLLLAYMGTGFLDTVFDAALEALSFLNPFRFMIDAINGNYGDAGGINDPVANEPAGAFGGLRDAFGQIYDVLLNIGWLLVVPILLISLAVGVVFLKRAGTGGKAKKVIIVITFMASGLPVFGGLYTAALTSMTSTDASGVRSASTKIVISSLVDFESWVSTSRLAPPAGQTLTWNRENHSPTATSDAAVRVSALEINTMNNSAFASLRENRFASTLQGEGFDYSWGSQVAGNQQKNYTGDNTTGGKISVGESLTGFDAARDLLLRYAKGSLVTASGFESQVKGALNAVPAEDVLKWFSELSNPETLARMTTKDVVALNNPLVQVDNEYAGLKGYLDDKTWSFYGLDADPACALGAGGGVVPVDWEPGGGALLPCNFSIMAMYNYLNTSFGPTSMETFSPEQTMNAYSRTNHASVTAVGAGPAGLLYFFSALSVLGSFVVIGFGYALSMMFSTIKRGFHLMGSVLAASVGLVSGVAKVTVFTAAMLLEVLGTLFLYKLVQEMILLIPGLLEKPLAAKVSANGALDALSVGGGDDAKAWGIVALLVTLISTIGIVIFTVIAMKLRRGLLDSIDQATTNIINKFTETQVGSGMAPSPPGALRQGMSRGASMAASSLMMGGIGGGGDEAAAAGGAGTDVGEGGEGAGVEGAAQAGSDGSKVAAPVEGAAGVNGDGSMSVGKDGAMQDAAGNPVMSRSGAPMGLDSFVPVDSSSGHVLDQAGGSPIVGADGSPLAADDVGGFDSEGNMLGADGSPLTDANGTQLSSAAARQASGSLMGAEALAQRVQANGLSPMASNPLTVPGGDTTPEPATPATPTPKVLGEVSMSEHALRDGGEDDPSVLRTAAVSAVVGTAASRLGGQRQRKHWLSGQGGTLPSTREERK